MLEKQGIYMILAKTRTFLSKFNCEHFIYAFINWEGKAAMKKAVFSAGSEISIQKCFFPDGHKRGTLHFPENVVQ